MNFLVLCAALSMGVVLATARPEGEASPVSNPALAAEETAADPKPVEEEPAEEESTRPKRWYYYGPGYGPNLGNPYPFNGVVQSASFRAPLVSPPGPTGRTRYAPNHPGNSLNPTFNELVNHQRNNEQLWQHQQWQRDQFKQQNLPDVIDTAAPVAPAPFVNQGFNTYNTRPFNNQGFNTFSNRPFDNQGFNTFDNRQFDNQGFNTFSNRPFDNQGFNNFDNRPFDNERFSSFNRPMNNPGFNSEFENRPPVIETQSSESRTRFRPTMMQNPQAGPMGDFTYPQNWQGWNNQNFYRPY